MKRVLLAFVLVFIGSVCFAGDISTYKLDNGQTIVIEQVKNNPIVTIDTWIRTGSINENDSNSGISHFLEHLFFKGTEKHPTGEFDKILESKGALTNAATSKDFTHYYITISSKYFDTALELHADMLLNPQIPRKEMEKERKVVLEEIAKDANNPSSICNENLNELLYTSHPYKRKVIGSAKVVENVSRETILNYYKKYYTPSNMTTLIIGDVNPEHVMDVVKQNFNTPYKKAVVNNFKKEKFLTSQKRNIRYMPTQVGYMMMGFRSADISSSDTYALDVLATILGDGQSSKLYQSLKEQKQLVTSVSASNSTMKDDGVFIVNSSFQPQNAQKVENAIFTEINKIKESGVSEDDLKIAKKIIETDTYYSRESVSNIAQELGYIITLTGGSNYYNEYLNRINKVTAQDVKRVANKYLTKNNSAISLVLPESQKNTAQVSPASKNHTAKLVSSNDNTKKYVLDNNATLLVADNEYNDIVAIAIFAKGGNFLESKRGTSRMFADLLMKGTKQYSAIELAKALDENGINITFSPNADSFNIDVLTTKKQVETELELLSDMINNSSFDDIDIEKDRTILMNKIKQNRDNPLNLAIDGYKSHIYKDSVYSTSYTLLEKSLPHVTREDIKSYQAKILNPDNIVISVNGKVDTDTLVNKFGNMFSSSSQGKFDYNKYSIPKLTSQTQVVKKADNQQTAWVILGWQVNGVNNIKDYATLEVMNTILGSGMSSRLFRSIREQEGLAYQVGSSYSPNVLAGSFNVYVGTNPKTAARAKQKMLNEIEKFKTQFVSGKELKEAKERLLGEFVIALETNNDKATTIGWFEASDRGYGFIDEYEKLIKAVTVSDIVEVANKYFKNNYTTSIVTTK